MRDERHANDGLFQLGRAELPGGGADLGLSPCRLRAMGTPRRAGPPSRGPAGGRPHHRLWRVGEVIESQLSLHRLELVEELLLAVKASVGLLRA